jgi:transcription elongation factor Elf1
MECPDCSADINLEAISGCGAKSGAVTVYFECEACQKFFAATVVPEMFEEIDQLDLEEC